MAMTRRTPAGPAFRVTLLVMLMAGSVAASCTSPTAPLPEGPPFAMEFGIAGFVTPSSAWHVRGDTVKYYRVSWDGELLDAVAAVPTAEQWQRFWTVVSESGVRRWRGKYEAPEIQDGVGWYLLIRDRRLLVVAQGSNAFPDRLGRRHLPELTPEFQAFYRAMLELVGRGPVLADQVTDL